MQIYRVFNQNNVMTKVTDAELDELVSTVGPLATHHINAAGEARRRDLVPHLRETLTTGERRPKLAAARALLALTDVESVALLNEHARTEKDSVVASMFRVTALRLQSVVRLREAFEGQDVSTELKRYVPSVYPGTFDLTSEDCAFLIDALVAYLDKTAPWIAALERPVWRNGAYILVTTLTQHMPERVCAAYSVRMREVLARVVGSKADADSKREAKQWLKTHDTKESSGT